MSRVLSLCRRLIIGYWRVFKQPTARESIQEIFTIRGGQSDTPEQLSEPEDTSVTGNPTVTDFSTSDDTTHRDTSNSR